MKDHDAVRLALVVTVVTASMVIATPQLLHLVLRHRPQARTIRWVRVCFAVQAVLGLSLVVVFSTVPVRLGVDASSLIPVR